MEFNGWLYEPHQKARMMPPTACWKNAPGLRMFIWTSLWCLVNPNAIPVERTLSVAYFALIDIHQYEEQLSGEHSPEWFLLDNMPDMVFDHAEMVTVALKQLRYKAALHPILFQLLPGKFTIPQLQALYEGVYQTEFDDRNFSRKLLSTGFW
jgi:8-oxo-dGTP diphosphatase